MRKLTTNISYLVIDLGGRTSSWRNDPYLHIMVKFLKATEIEMFAYPVAWTMSSSFDLFLIVSDKAIRCTEMNK
jgi:hypothetical protein